jgi:hypothetical protein
MINKKLVLIFLIAIILSSCGVYLPTVDGPESPELLQHIQGYIITDKAVGGLVAIELPSEKEIVVRKADDNHAPIHCLSGPDNKGRIAVIESGNETYTLKIIDIGARKEREIFTRQGSYWPHYDENYGDSFSFSNSGGMIAYIRNYKSESSFIPNRSIQIGQLVIVNSETGKIMQTEIKALDEGLAWFPDGEKLLYSAIVNRTDLPKNIATSFDDNFAGEMKAWQNIPVVFQLDLKKMIARQLHVGLNPIVSRDGDSVLLQDYAKRMRLYKVSTDESTAIDIPAAKDAQVFSFIGEELFLYRGLPTKGSSQKWRFTSTFGRVPIWTLKVAHLKSGKFKTIVQELDIHRRVSFGGKK